MVKRKRTSKNEMDHNLLIQAEEQANTERVDRLKRQTEAEHIEHINEISDSMSDVSSSSSSDEDSDDDFELEIKSGVRKAVARKKAMRTDSSDDEDDKSKAVIAAIERKLDKEQKQRRLLIKNEKQMSQSVSDDEDVLCDYESNQVQRNRKRRLFRRKMLRGPMKRRRIKRAQDNVAEEYTCDTFLEFGSTVKNLSTNLDLSDDEVDLKALEAVFEEFGLTSRSKSDDLVCSASDSESEEDETDIIANQLRFYQSRNMRERIDQLNNLPINPFSEKLIEYHSPKALYGSRSTSIRNYHPEIFIKKGIHKLPPSLIWKRPFSHLIYQKSTFDPHKETNDFLNKKLVEKKEEKQEFLLEEVMNLVREKWQAKNPQELYLVDDDSMMYGDGAQEGEDDFDELVIE